MTISAANGAEALKLCGMVVPALMILDITLPDIDGFEVVEWMRTKPPLRQVPILVYSAAEISIADQQRLRLGPTVFLTKSRAPLNVLIQRAMSLLRSEPAPSEVAGAA
jgi:CheY-like chemotaxis protein